jgi:hypothetical protein
MPALAGLLALSLALSDARSIFVIAALLRVLPRTIGTMLHRHMRVPS